MRGRAEKLPTKPAKLFASGFAASGWFDLQAAGVQILRLLVI